MRGPGGILGECPPQGWELGFLLAVDELGAEMLGEKSDQGGEADLDAVRIANALDEEE